MKINDSSTESRNSATNGSRNHDHPKMRGTAQRTARGFIQRTVRGAHGVGRETTWSEFRSVLLSVRVGIRKGNDRDSGR